jgi:integrase
VSADTAGTWVARAADPDGESTYVFRSLGSFADLKEVDRFDAAQKAAAEWFGHLSRGGSTAILTAAAACEAYVRKVDADNRPPGDPQDNQEAGAEYKPRSAPALDVHGRFKRLVYADKLASIDLEKLRVRDIADWKERVRAKSKSDSGFYRNLTALRAALNLALKRREVTNALAWSEELKRPKGSTDRSRTLYLSLDERRALIAEAGEELKPLLKAACLLPLRPGELVACRVSDFDVAHSALRVPDGKTGSRIVPLGRDAIAHFKACGKNKLPSAWLVSRTDGRQWTRFDWRGQIKLAAAAAKLPGATTLYVLRHSVLTDLITGGLDLATTAKVSGTSIAMIQRHYHHLQQDVARAALDKVAL